ncbi:MBL fold metallo-hydrolase [Aureimonas populi]|uniref:MBL fold metallo-hydrolase n=1 Tax=Aureimonas populi TaxID=1701758 RepID=A0ABW5CIN2_9HYPH|nr:MBL fold metallo-hydrolase [Aureimonas populi]
MARNSIDRRNALKAAAASLAIGGLYHTQANAQEGSQEAAMADDNPFAPGWRRFRIGEIEVTQVLDGIRPGEGPHPTFGEDRSAEEVAALMAENLLPENRFVNFFQPTILRIGGEVILVDTGFGASGRENGMGLLVPRMAAAGFRPEDVTIVVLTHLHGDHINGLMEDGSPVFSNATLAVGRVEYEFWTSDEARGGPAAGNAEAVAAQVVPLEQDIRLLEDGEEVVPGLRAHAAFGHTPGMLVFEVGAGADRLFLTADALSQFVVSFQRPDWHVRFDMDKQAAVDTRRRLLEMLAEEGVPMTGYHLPFPALGYVMAEGEAYRFVPASYQLEV